MKIRYVKVTLAVMFLVGGIGAAFGQERPVPTPPRPPAVPRVDVRVPTVRLPRTSRRGESIDSEMRIASSSGVNLKFCVAEADLKINGWERNEVRVYVRSGLRFEMRVLERENGTDRAHWVWIRPPQPQGAGQGPAPACLSGDAIEMDVPIGAVLSIEGRSTDTVVDSVRKVGIKIVEGSIALRNVTDGITASALQGDLVIENSSGAISLDSTTGNIAVFGVKPGQIGDAFRAKTNSGSISVQQSIHRQIDASSISGSVLFSGALLEGGIYSFKTSNGAIELALPESVSAKIAASFGFGSFDSDLPIEILTENEFPGGKSIVGTIGAGTTNVNVTTTSGRIGIRKQD